MTGAFAFLWLVSSSAWGKGLSDVKWATDPVTIVSLTEVCKGSTNKCTPGAMPHMGRLNASVVSCMQISLFQTHLNLWSGFIYLIFVLFFGRFLVFLTLSCGAVTAGSFTRRRHSTNQPTSLQRWREELGHRNYTASSFQNCPTCSFIKLVILVLFVQR